MAEVMMFHHVQGLTDGVLAFAENLRSHGHTVHTPDLYAGALPESIEDGIALIQAIGDEVLDLRVVEAVADLPPGVVFAGFSWGSAKAQGLAQLRPGARGALLYEGCLPITGDWSFGPWPDGVPVQIHGMANDPFFAQEGDLDSARELVESVGPELAELFVYPGDAHLFTDSSLPSYDAAGTTLVLQRSLAFLDRVDTLSHA
ncbi:MAG: dienelactone hydrolase family protein [Micropruina sp.]|nr:dienelactone hydrolase family protein [Micropruina sp.]